MVILDDYILVLEKSALFRGIEGTTIGHMISCFAPLRQRYKKTEQIVTAGEPYTGIGIVIEGEVLVTKESIAGNRTIMSVLKKGDMFGEMVSFTDVKKWPATVTAQSDSEVIFIKPELVVNQCEKVCDGHRKMIENLMKIMAKKALMLNKKLEYLSIRSLRGRLSAYLLEQYTSKKEAMFLLPMNRDELADFFNVTRPSLSRELSRMKAEKIIDFHKSTFKILDLEALKEALENA